MCAQLRKIWPTRHRFYRLPPDSFRGGRVPTTGTTGQQRPLFPSACQLSCCGHMPNAIFLHGCELFMRRTKILLVGLLLLALAGVARAQVGPPIGTWAGRQVSFRLNTNGSYFYRDPAVALTGMDADHSG